MIDTIAVALTHSRITRTDPETGRIHVRPVNPLLRAGAAVSALAIPASVYFALHQPEPEPTESALTAAVLFLITWALSAGATGRRHLLPRPYRTATQEQIDAADAAADAREAAETQQVRLQARDLHRSLAAVLAPQDQSADPEVLPDLGEDTYWDTGVHHRSVFIERPVGVRPWGLVQARHVDPDTRDVSLISVTLYPGATPNGWGDTTGAVILNCASEHWTTLAADLTDALTRFTEESSLRGGPLLYPATIAAADGEGRESLRVEYAHGRVSVQGVVVSVDEGDRTRFRLLRPVFKVWVEREMAQARRAAEAPLHQAEAEREARDRATVEQALAGLG